MAHITFQTRTKPRSDSTTFKLVRLNLLAWNENEALRIIKFKQRIIKNLTYSYLNMLRNHFNNSRKHALSTQLCFVLVCFKLKQFTCIITFLCTATLRSHYSSLHKKGEMLYLLRGKMKISTARYKMPGPNHHPLHCLQLVKQPIYTFSI